MADNRQMVLIFKFYLYLVFSTGFEEYSMLCSNENIGIPSLFSAEVWKTHEVSGAIYLSLFDLKELLLATP